jgi:hypothetical protein
VSPALRPCKLIALLYWFRLLSVFPTTYKCIYSQHKKGGIVCSFRLQPLIHFAVSDPIRFSSDSIAVFASLPVYSLLFIHRSFPDSEKRRIKKKRGAVFLSFTTPGILLTLYFFILLRNIWIRSTAKQEENLEKKKQFYFLVSYHLPIRSQLYNINFESTTKKKLLDKPF